MFEFKSTLPTLSLRKACICCVGSVNVGSELSVTSLLGNVALYCDRAVLRVL